jgi:hypothetical protein
MGGSAKPSVRIANVKMCTQSPSGPHVSHTGTERAGCHRFFGRGTYGLHCKGVTASGVPLPELTQPAAVERRHGPAGRGGRLRIRLRGRRASRGAARPADSPARLLRAASEIGWRTASQHQAGRAAFPCSSQTALVHKKEDEVRCSFDVGSPCLRPELSRAKSLSERHRFSKDQLHSGELISCRGLDALPITVEALSGS